RAAVQFELDRSPVKATSFLHKNQGLQKTRKASQAYLAPGPVLLRVPAPPLPRAVPCRSACRPAIRADTLRLGGDTVAPGQSCRPRTPAKSLRCPDGGPPLEHTCDRLREQCQP